MPQATRVVIVDGKPNIFPADATDEEISAALNAPPATARGVSKTARTWTDVAVDALPAVGGAVGGVIGGIGGTVAGLGIGGVPGAIGGATIGGAGGEGLRQSINALRGRGPLLTPGQALGDIGKQGAIQGASEAAGAGLMKGASMAAHGLMDFAIRPAPTVAKEFGDIAGTALAERLPVGSVLPGGAKGSQLAQQALRESAGTTRDLLSAAGKAGTTFDAVSLARGPVSEMAGEIAKQPLSEAELHQVSRLFSEYLDTHPAQMTPNTVKDMKQAAQRIAKPIFRALNAGNIPPAGEAMKAQFNRAIATGAKDALETIPGMAASEGRTQSLIGATKAIRQAEVRRLPLVAELAAPIAGAAVGGATGRDTKSVGEGVGTALLVRALLSPRSTSRAALGLTVPAIQEVVRQMPRAAVYALLAQVTGSPTGDPAPGGRP